MIKELLLFKILNYFKEIESALGCWPRSCIYTPSSGPSLRPPHSPALQVLKSGSRVPQHPDKYYSKNDSPYYSQDDSPRAG